MKYSTKESQKDVFWKSLSLSSCTEGSAPVTLKFCFLISCQQLKILSFIKKLIILHFFHLIYLTESICTKSLLVKIMLYFSVVLVINYFKDLTSNSLLVYSSKYDSFLFHFLFLSIDHFNIFIII